MVERIIGSIGIANWFAIWVTALLLLVLKAVWYSDYLFGDKLRTVFYGDEFKGDAMPGSKLVLYLFGLFADIVFLLMLSVLFSAVRLDHFWDRILFTSGLCSMMLIVLGLVCLVDSRVWRSFSIHFGYLISANLVSSFALSAVLLF